MTKPKGPSASLINPKGRVLPKQVFIEFSVEKGGNKQNCNSGQNKVDSDQEELDYSKLTEQDEDPQQDVNIEYVSRTKIMLVCTNNIKEDTYFSGLSSVDSIIDLIMTDDKIAVAKKDKQVTSRGGNSFLTVKSGETEAPKQKHPLLQDDEDDAVTKAENAKSEEERIEEFANNVGRFLDKIDTLKSLFRAFFQRKYSSGFESILPPL
ncbi:MAG: hypothetical protein EOO43_12160 [Flavobacterium sp.]|nr:MAG: hypothetical protein EOO43_12160 [Flavobacterium sp.]